MSVFLSSHDIGWVTGIYEGEGTCELRNKQITVTIWQKDRWILDKLQGMYGGRVGEARKNTKYYIFYWSIGNSKAAAFLRQVYPYLSPRRQNQAAPLLEFWEKKEETL